MTDAAHTEATNHDPYGLIFADVRDGSLPGQDFHRRLSRAIYGTA